MEPLLGMVKSAMLRLYTFGGLQIKRDDLLLQLSTHKARELFAYLVTFRGRSHPRSVLAGILYPEIPEDKARRRLSDTLWRARQILEDAIVVDGEHLQFHRGRPYWLDVEALERAAAIDQPTDLAEQTVPPPDQADLEKKGEAIELYRGPFLEGFYGDWVLLERERLRGLYLQLLGQLLAWHKQLGDYAAALMFAQRIVALEPLHESAHRALMRLYCLLGRRAEGIAQYQHCRQVLRDELDVAPAPETEALYQVIRRQDPAPSAAPAVHLPQSAHRPLPSLDRPPLAGRQAERAILLGHLEAAASGKGGIVLLEGEAGIGKTRLAEELVAGARWRNIQTTVAATDAALSSSYALLQAALEPLLTPMRIKQLARLIGPVDLQVTAPLLPLIGETLPDLLPSPEQPPPQARARLQRALVNIICGLSQIAPHLWVLEDLQWADSETVALLPPLLERIASCRILLLLTGRSAGLRAAPAVWSSLQDLDRAGPIVHLELSRLPGEAIGRLVGLLHGEEQPVLSEHLARESEGVPLYISELLKAWRDAGHLVPTEQGRWDWQGGEPAVQTSPLGGAVIAHRLAQLSPLAEQVGAIAATIGAEIDLDLLAEAWAAAAAAEETAADHRLLMATDELLRLGLLVETNEGYRFGHEQIRRALYERLSVSKQRRLHLLVGRAMEAASPYQFEALAHHFVAAGERASAGHYLRRAADRARELFAHETARSYYDRLLELLTRPEDGPIRYDVLHDRARVLGWMGERPAQGHDLEAMRHLAEALSDEARLTGALRLRSEWHRLQGDYQAAEEEARAALAIYRRQGEDRARAELLCQTGWNVIYTGDHSRAAADFRQALSIFERLDDLAGQINALAGLTAAAELDGDYYEALVYLRQNMALARATGDPRRVGRALHNMGVIHYDLGAMAAAEESLHQALQLKEVIGDRRSQAITRFYLGLIAIEEGRLEQARHQLERAREVFCQVQDRSWEGDLQAALGRLALRRGDPAAAHSLLAAAYQRRRELGEPGYAVVDRSYLALAELALGDRSAAWEQSRAAIDELEAGLAGVEHPQRLYYNHFQVAEANRQWAAARAALERAAQIVAERAACIDEPDLREAYRSGHRVHRAIAQALAEQPAPGCLRVRLARADVPAHRRPRPDEVVSLIWTVDNGPPDTALGEREGPVALRRHRLLRLLATSQEAGALPTVADLAGALEVSSRTVRSDLQALRQEGHRLSTRGHRC